MTWRVWTKARYDLKMIISFSFSEMTNSTLTQDGGDMPGLEGEEGETTGKGKGKSGGIEEISSSETAAASGETGASATKTTAASEGGAKIEELS